jgi:hypothetical protein
MSEIHTSTEYEPGARVAVAAQIFTLSGVALGALCSYLVTSLNERSRYRRDVAMRLGS